MRYKIIFEEGDRVNVDIHDKGGYWVDSRPAQFVRYTQTGRITVLLYNALLGKDIAATYDARNVHDGRPANAGTIVDD